MSIIDKLKAVFVVPSNEQTNSSEIIGGTDPKRNVSTETSTPPYVEISPKSNEAFLEILASVLEKNNQPGFDYLEFKKAIQSIARLNTMAEDAQYKTAYAAAQSMNVNPSNLINSAKQYLMVLEAEHTQFNQTANQYLQSQLNAKESESTQLKISVQNLEKQISQLQEELQKNKKRLLDIDKELSTARSKVESNKAGFVASYDQLVGQIKSDIQKMEQYLK